MTISDTVSRLMSHATMRITHPAATLLELANRLTTPGSDEPAPPGSQRKLQDADAFAVLEAVTRMMRRHGLSPSLVCEAAKVANQAKDFYKFHLTQTEMDETGRLVAAPKAGRRVHRGLAPYLRMVRRIAAEAGVPEADLLEELGAAIPDFLAPFAAVDRDVWETVFDDIALLGGYFSRPRQGSDGQPIDLRRFFSDAVSEGVGYSPGLDRMATEPEEPSPDEGFWQAPSVPLFARTVVVGAAECWFYEETQKGERFRVPIGEVKANVVEVVHLGLVPSGRGLKAILFAEPFTAILGTPNDGGARSFMDRPPSAFVRGTPLSDSLVIPAKDTPYHVAFVDETVRFQCDAYEAHVRRHAGEADSDDANSAMRWYSLESLNVARRIELDPDTLRTLLDRQSDEKWRVLLTFTRGPKEFDGEFVLPDAVTLTGDQRSEALIDRLKAALIGDDQVIVRALTDRATRRVRAMDRFMADRATSERTRRDRYRRMMRS